MSAQLMSKIKKSQTSRIFAREERSALNTSKNHRRLFRGEKNFLAFCACCRNQSLQTRGALEYEGRFVDPLIRPTCLTRSPQWCGMSFFCNGKVLRIVREDQCRMTRVAWTFCKRIYSKIFIKKDKLCTVVSYCIYRSFYKIRDKWNQVCSYFISFVNKNLNKDTWHFRKREREREVDICIFEKLCLR